MSVGHETLYNKPIWEPKASIRTYFEAGGGPKASHFNEIVILGSGMKRGDPNPTSILRFRDPQKAKAILGTGVVYDLMKLCWSPSKSPTVFGANYIDVIRVGTNPLQASLSLIGGGGPVLVVTSLDYGADANGIRVKVEAGSVAASSKKITVAKVDDDGVNIVNSYDNLRNALSIQYSGSGTCTMTITVNASKVATQLATTTSANNNLTIDLTDTNYDTLSKICNYIEGQSDYTCTLDTYANPTMPTSYLDAVVAQDIKTTAYTATAILGSIIHEVSSYDPYVTIARSSTATTTPDVVNYQYLASGSDGTVDTAAYVASLAKLEAESIQKGILLIESTETAVAVAVAAWVKTQRENDNGRWHVFVGHPTSATDTAEDDMTLATHIGVRAKQLNSQDVTLCGPAVKIYDSYSTLQTYPSTYLAAICAGQLAGSGLEQPLTNNTVPIDGLDAKFDIDEREYLIESGVLTVKYDKSIEQYVISYGLTTYTQSDERFYRVLFVKNIVDTIEWNIKIQVEQRFKGKKARYDTPNSIQAFVLSLLRDFEERLQLIVRNPADPTSVAYTMPSVSISEGVATISYNIYVVDEIDFIDVTQRAQLQQLQSVVRAELA